MDDETQLRPFEEVMFSICHAYICQLFTKIPQFVIKQREMLNVLARLTQTKLFNNRTKLYSLHVF